MEILNRLKDLANDLSLLYVEDDLNLQKQTKEFLSKFFKHIDVAENGKAGLELYTKNQYAIIITDIKMPIMNGMDMIEKIHEINQSQLILVISAFDFSELLKPQHMTHMINSFLLKPVNTQNLVETLINLCQQYKKEHNNIEIEMKREIDYLKEKVIKIDEKLDRIIALIK